MATTNRQTALITGASAGIGRELAKVFAEHHCNLVLVARSEDKLENLAQTLRLQHRIEVTALAMDLATSTGPQAVFDAVESEGIEVEILVNNAGQVHYSRFQDGDLQEYLQIIKLNVTAMTALTWLFLQPMVTRGHGRILNVASIAAFAPMRTLSVYAATKAYVLSLSEALAMELQNSGVTVTALCPGVTKTAMHEKWLDATRHQLEFPELLLMTAEDVARAGYDACLRGESVEICGLANRALTLTMQYTPRWVLRNISQLVTRWVK